MRNIILILIFSLFIIPVEGKKLQRVVNDFATDSNLTYSSVGISICDIKTQKEIAGFNSLTADVPASTMKALTCATALNILGSEYRYNTYVKLVGDSDKEGGFIGDILIEASGDPTLSSKYFPNNPDFIDEIINKIKRVGFNNIKGNIIITPTWNVTEGVSLNWTLDDVAWGYGTGAYMFNYADNTFNLPITIKENEILVGTTNPQLPNLKVINKCVFTDEKESFVSSTPDIVRGVNSDEIILSGIIRRNGGERNLSCAMPNPREFFVNELIKRMNVAGITFTQSNQKIKNDTLLLLHHTSPMLMDIVKSALWRSDNMYTECILRALGKEKFNLWSADASIDILNKYWISEGLNVKQLFMTDGSGLSRKNKVSAQFLSKMLIKAQENSRWQATDYASLFPRLGMEGTVRNRLAKTNYSGKIALKSGSMSHVQCFTGYFPVSNPQFTITILINNFNGTRNTLTKNIDQLLLNVLPLLEKEEK